jgi:hypothetical protein
MKGPISIPLLLGTKTGIELATQFLQDTRIATRDWIEGSEAVERGGDEGEERQRGL